MLGGPRLLYQRATSILLVNVMSLMPLNIINNIRNFNLNYSFYIHLYALLISNLISNSLSHYVQ